MAYIITIVCFNILDIIICLVVVTPPAALKVVDSNPVEHQWIYDRNTYVRYTKTKYHIFQLILPLINQKQWETKKNKYLLTE